jgi:mono/diheme cytochrome c family protein
VGYRRRPILLPAGLVLLVHGACADREITTADAAASEVAAMAGIRAAVAGDPRMVAEGRQIFRFDDFGDWRFWTDTAQLHVLMEQVSPELALALGLQVDADAVPPAVLQAVLADPAQLASPATTRALLALDAVVGVTARVEGDRITRMGITCAFCHSTVDNSVAPGIGSRQDGWPNRGLAVGTILSLLPGLADIAAALGVDASALQAAFASWPAGFYDARVNIDGRLGDPPVVIPAAYGLAEVGVETYTGEGPISYWNNYVAVTQMRGRGSFHDPKLGLRIVVPPQDDEVRKKLPALRQYQFSLAAPAPPPGSFDAAAAARGQELFTGAGQCSSCHVGPALTGHGRLHDPAATGMEPTWAERSTTGRYRATPLRGVWQRPPYFHDGSAPTLLAVVEHYNQQLGLGLTMQQQEDLVEYLKSL